MRLVHTSDTHLGHQQYGKLGADGLNVREADIATAWHAVITHALQNPPDVFLHAGDLFDGVRPGNRPLATAMEGLLALSQAGIPTVIIAGNHEHPRMRGTGSPFRIFAHLPNIHVVYKGARESISIDTATGPATIHAVPQCADQDTLTSEVAQIQRAPGHNILMLHGAISHLDVFKNAEFNEQILNPDWFDDRFDYVALGHFHKTTEVTPKAWYCGAPERVSISEAGEAKNYLDVTLDDTHQVVVSPCPIAGRPYRDLPPIQARHLQHEELVQAAQTALSRVPEGAVARLRLLDVDASLRGVLDVRSLQNMASHALHLEIKVAWHDGPEQTAGSLEFGGLEAEFEEFAMKQPIEGVPRDELLQLGRHLLGDTP